MGWANCGEDSKGRPIGYAHSAKCDHSGCKEKIDRGLSYVCGDMHGEDEVSCERYFCPDHRQNFIKRVDDDREIQICNECAIAARKAGFVMDEEEGVLVWVEEAES